jgi:hypothetical protein
MANDISNPVINREGGPMADHADMKSVVRAMIFVVCFTSVVMLSGCGGGSSLQSPLGGPTITTASVPDGTLDAPYSHTIQATGGVAPFTWTVSVGALPHNLTLSASATNTATISGTPDAAVVGAAFSITVKDSMNQSASRSYSVSVVLGPDPVTLNPGTLDFSCVARLVGGGCTPPEQATLTNTGTSTLTLLGISITGMHFSQTNNCPAILEPEESCTITVSFDGPASRSQPRKKTFTGFVYAYDDVTQSPQEIALTGTTSGVP